MLMVVADAAAVDSVVALLQLISVAVIDCVVLNTDVMF